MSYIPGTDGNDTIEGTSFSDYVEAFGGNDLVLAGWGNDYVDGGFGDDTLKGGKDYDSLLGGTGNDMLFAIVAGLGADTLTGGTGADTFVLEPEQYDSPEELELGYLLELGVATITDFNRIEGDKIQVFGNESDYSLGFQNTSGGTALDTFILYQGNIIAVVEDTTDVALSSDFIFVPLES